jgi:hypothetical protein
MGETDGEDHEPNRQLAALRKVAGTLRDVGTPGGKTPEAVTEWVAKSRLADDDRLDTLRGDRVV